MKNINPQKIYQETHETGLKAMVKCNPIPIFASFIFFFIMLCILFLTIRLWKNF